MTAAHLLAAGQTTSTGASVTFWVLAVISVAAGLGMVLARRAVHCAVLLAVVMLSLAILYATAGAPFLAFVQIIVYTGAVLMLFLFVLMIVGVSTHAVLTVPRSPGPVHPRLPHRTRLPDRGRPGHTMTVPVVGALLIFSLMIGPPAAAILLSVVIALVTVWADRRLLPAELTGGFLRRHPVRAVLRPRPRLGRLEPRPSSTRRPAMPWADGVRSAGPK